jgi:eukaryotic-like serine/threonine-protein kinase
VSDEAARPDGPTLPRCPHCGGDHPAHLLKCPDTDLALPLEGRVLHGKFRFVRQLGRGGMAAVWAAVNTLVERRVAIKIIRPEAGRSEETVARFRAEAKAAGRIGHPNVCEILDFGLGPLGPYIVMERLRGKSLGELIRDEERLDPALAAAIVRQALAGLEAAHRHGIIHRDLKPENLFIHQSEVGPPMVKIMDFGVSKFTDGSSEVETEHGALLGTPEYMSPEQFRGAAGSDARTDIWAMGAILYKVLTGKTAFAAGSVPGTLLMVSSDEPTPMAELVRGVPPELVAIVERCLRKDPDERFQTAQELAEELEPFDLESLASLVVVSDEASQSREEPSPATISVGPKSRNGERSRSQSNARSEMGESDTLLPTTRPRITVDEARKPIRPERRAWLLIAGVTVIGAGVLVALTQGSTSREGQELASTAAAEPRQGAGAATTGAEVPPAASTEAATTDGATAGTAAVVPPRPADTTAGTEPPADASTGDAPAGDATAGVATAGVATTGVATAGVATTGVAPIGVTPTGGEPTGDEPTTGIPEGPDELDDDGGSDPALDPEQPPPTPPGTIRVGRFLTLEKPGPAGTHAEARAYCRALAKQAFVGVKSWTLTGPQTARKLAPHIKKGKYWTTALWKGKALVMSAPSKATSSLAAEKKGPRALCIAKWP